MEFQKIPIYCPKCGTRVLYWNGITKMQIATTCTGCGKFVLYDPEINKVSVSNFHPERTTSSGKRFY